VNALLDVKVDTISILLATLYEGQEVATKAENEIDMLRLDSGLVPVNKLLSFSQDEPLGLMLQKALAEQEEFCVILATPEHLTGSREILQRLSKMAEILRAFIVENFTLEDLL
jgi:hypothetical protein